MNPLPTLALLFLLMFTPTALAFADDKPPITPADLQLASDPQAPGAAAVVLYRQVDRDDNSTTGSENNFIRIKILKDEGRKYADVEIPYYKDTGSQIAHISARTIRPDGSVLEFKGKPFDKSIVKAKGLKYMAKTFTLPGVQIGCVIEYSYTTELPEGLVFDSHWILSHELFTKRAKFSLKPYGMFQLRWSWHLLPPGTEPPKQGPDQIIRMEANNIPAFQVEDYMPPEDELKSRVDFTYSAAILEKDPASFWKNRGKHLNAQVESFIGKRKAMEEAVAQIVSPGDTPDAKLQKIYARVQQLRNISSERDRTAQERKRDKQKENNTVEDVWKHGYGYARELNWLFLALTRAAGLESYAVFVSDRYHFFFDPALMDSQKLDYDLVLVKLNGKDIFCDPGVAFTPFGLLMWSETSVQGLRLDKDGGTWITTMLPKSSDSQIVRHAELVLSETGDIEGKLTVTFTGLKAMDLRREERDEDETARRKALEDEVKGFIPAASDIELTNRPDWTSSSSPFLAEFKLRVDGWASSAGRKFMLPVGLFSAGEKQVFEHAERVHPIYFEYPAESNDDIVIALPAGWQVSNIPKEVSQSGQVVAYSLKAENTKGSVKISRQLAVNILLMDKKYYPALRNFYQGVRTTDEEQILLQPGGTAASN
jgi:hypothetical protein